MFLTTCGTNVNMNNKQKYQCFLSALRWYVDDGGHGTKAHIAKNTGVTASFIGQIIKPTATKKARPEVQEKIAEFLIGSLDDFIVFGASILNIPIPETITDKTTANGIVHFTSKIEMEHAEVIKTFYDKATAKDFNQVLSKLEKLKPSEYYALYGKIKGMVVEMENPIEKGRSDGKSLGEELIDNEKAG